MTDRLELIKDKWNIPPVLPASVPWGKDDVAWLVGEVERLRAKVRLITEQYKPGWVDGLNAVALNEGFDPDDARHSAVDPPTFIQDVIESLRRSLRRRQEENDRLRAALEKSMKINPYGSIENADARDTALRALGFDAVDPDTLGTLARDPHGRRGRKDDDGPPDPEPFI